MHIFLGKVSTIRNARQHLDVLGRAHCGAGRGSTITATRWRADATIRIADVCRRCLKALRRAVASAAATGDTYAADAAIALEPNDPRRDDALVADIRAHLSHVYAPQPTPRELAGVPSYQYAERLLKELRA